MQGRHRDARLTCTARVRQAGVTAMLKDKFGREIHDLRISVTDRCNLACVYCKSADSHLKRISPDCY